MKILQVFDFFSPLHGGGVVSVVYQLSQALANRGHEVSIYTSDFEYDEEFIKSLNKVKVKSFHDKFRIYGFHYIPDVKKEIKHNLKSFDVIHFQTYRSYQNLVIFKQAKKQGIPYVVDSHGSLTNVIRQGRKKIFDKLFGYSFLRKANYCIAETQVGIQEYKDMGIDEKKIKLLPPGFNTDEYKTLQPRGNFRKKFNIQAKKIIMFFGRINWIKGVDFLVETFAELLKDRNDVVLILAGPDDGLKPALEVIIKKHKIEDRVLFTGFLSNEDKRNALMDADMVVQPSRYENGIAWSSLDALMSQTPIIVADKTGSAEDVKKMDAGYVVSFGDKEELKKVMQFVLVNPDKALEKVKNAQKYIMENLSLQRNVIEYEKIYQQCVEENKNLRGK